MCFFSISQSQEHTDQMLTQQHLQIISWVILLRQVWARLDSSTSKTSQLSKRIKALTNKTRLKKQERKANQKREKSPKQLQYCVFVSLVITSVEK